MLGVEYRHFPSKRMSFRVIFLKTAYQCINIFINWTYRGKFVPKRHMFFSIKNINITEINFDP